MPAFRCRKRVLNFFCDRGYNAYDMYTYLVFTKGFYFIVIDLKLLLSLEVE